jgi:hypothetical protein
MSSGPSYPRRSRLSIPIRTATKPPPDRPLRLSSSTSRSSLRCLTPKRWDIKGSFPSCLLSYLPTSIIQRKPFKPLRLTATLSEPFEPSYYSTPTQDTTSPPPYSAAMLSVAIKPSLPTTQLTSHVQVRFLLPCFAVLNLLFLLTHAFTCYSALALHRDHYLPLPSHVRLPPRPHRQLSSSSRRVALYLFGGIGLLASQLLLPLGLL